MHHSTTDQRRRFLMEQTFATLFSLTNKVQMHADHCLNLLTARQLMTLIAIIHLPDGAASLKNIASKLGSSKQSTKHIVEGLKKKDFIHIEPNQQDKRAINITLTRLGKEAMLADAAKGYDFFDQLFQEFPDEQMELLWTLLQKLYAYDGVPQDGFEEKAHLSR